MAPANGKGEWVEGNSNWAKPRAGRSRRSRKDKEGDEKEDILPFGTQLDAFGLNRAEVDEGMGSGDC